MRQSLPQILVNVRFTASNDPLEDERVLKAVELAEKELAGRGRVLLRKSGTEPLIRVMVEGELEEQVIRLADNIAEYVRLVK